MAGRRRTTLSASELPAVHESRTGPRAFFERFGLSSDQDQAQAWFVNWVRNHLTADPVFRGPPPGLANEVASLVGRAYTVRSALVVMLENPDESPPEFVTYLPGGFLDMLMVLEHVYAAFSGADRAKARLDQIIGEGLSRAPADVGVTWHAGHFLPSGAPVLDEGLVADPLGTLADQGFTEAAAAFRQAAESLLRARSDENQLKNVIRDGYEALESAAKQVLENDRDLSANRELLVRRLRLSPDVAALLREVIPFANPYRHGAPADGRAAVSHSRAELFLYEVGLVLRAVLAGLAEGPDE